MGLFDLVEAICPIGSRQVGIDDPFLEIEPAAPIIAAIVSPANHRALLIDRATQALAI